MSNGRKLRAGIGSRRGWNTSAAVIGVGGLVVWSVSAADAATGGKFLLGKHNSETHTATLSNSKGTPLSLKAKAGSPPLKVNSSKLVPKLNANFVGGLPASKLQRRVTGQCAIGVASITVSGGVSCAKPGQLVFTADGTVTIPKGVTEVTGEIWGAGGGGGAAEPLYYLYGSGGGAGGHERVVIPVTTGQVLNVVVGAGGTGGTKFAAGTSGGSSAVDRPAGSVLAGAAGGAGGVYNCSSDVAGGQPLAIAAGVLGLEAHAGANGQCNGADSAGTYFVGAGGYSPYNERSGSGYDGQPGLVIINFAD